MPTTHLSHEERAPRGRPRRPTGIALPLALPVAVLLGGAAFVAYALWPRWPAPLIAPDAPALPITVGGTIFNVPPAALRVPVQRRPGAHERVDLAFLWPSLAPPDLNTAVAAAPGASAAPRMLDRVFVTIAVAGDAFAPSERVNVIYRRYVAAEPEIGANGLGVLAFRQGTPYQGEDLIYDAVKPEAFLVRCSRNGPGATPGTCLYSLRIEAADVVVRFPRDWLDDWRKVADGIERLIGSLRSKGT